MKIIHTADIHLDSPLSQVNDPVTRRYELLRALSDMAEYANNNDVSAVIVAGDLFDSAHATSQTIASVADIVKRCKAGWYVLQGNHGSTAPYDKLKQLVPQVNIFGDKWSYFNLGNVTICGRELGYDDVEQYAELKLDPSRYNIVVLHGDVDDEAYGLIDKKTLSASCVNYVALGHRHTLAKHSFGRVKACYCGALEARGFDEPSKTGFVLIDTDKDEIRFVEQYIRRIEQIVVDVSDITSDMALENAISDAVSGANKRNYLNITFTGVKQNGIHLDIVANNVLDGKFFALRQEDKTTVSYNIDELSRELSLRGEFVKLALQIEDDKLRNETIKFGLQALSGEDLA